MAIRSHWHNRVYMRTALGNKSKNVFGFHEKVLHKVERKESENAKRTKYARKKNESVKVIGVSKFNIRLVGCISSLGLFYYELGRGAFRIP